MDSIVEKSREARGWLKLLQNEKIANNAQRLTTEIYGLKAALSGLNQEMKVFSENSKESNKFLSQIAHLEKSIEMQNKIAAKLNLVLIVFTVLIFSTGVYLVVKDWVSTGNTLYGLVYCISLFVSLLFLLILTRSRS